MRYGSGPLRDEVTIQEVAETRDAYGGVIETWGTFATVRASVEPLIGREYFAAQQVQATSTHKIRIRYLSGLVPKMRVLFGVRVFDIESILNVNERNEEIVIMAKEQL